MTRVFGFTGLASMTAVMFVVRSGALRTGNANEYEVLRRTLLAAGMAEPPSSSSVKGRHQFHGRSGTIFTLDDSTHVLSDSHGHAALIADVSMKRLAHTMDRAELLSSALTTIESTKWAKERQKEWPETRLTRLRVHPASGAQNTKVSVLQSRTRVSVMAAAQPSEGPIGGPSDAPATSGPDECQAISEDIYAGTQQLKSDLTNLDDLMSLITPSGLGSPIIIGLLYGISATDALGIAADAAVLLDNYETNILYDRGLLGYLADQFTAFDCWLWQGLGDLDTTIFDSADDEIDYGDSDCDTETISIEISDDGGMTWTDYYDGPAEVCG